MYECAHDCGMTVVWYEYIYMLSYIYTSTHIYTPMSRKLAPGIPEVWLTALSSFLAAVTATPPTV